MWEGVRKQREEGGGCKCGGNGGSERTGRWVVNVGGSRRIEGRGRGVVYVSGGEGQKKDGAGL